MHKLKVNSVASLMSGVLLIVAASGQQKPEWHGTIGLEDGVRVINNPAKPLHGELELKLLEDLSIGSKNSEQSCFHLVWDVKSDTFGNIYVADTWNGRVQKYDGAGRYLRTLGKNAVGFTQPTRININEPSGTVFVQTSIQGIKMFNSNDQYQGAIDSKYSIHGFRPVDASRVIAIIGIQDDEKLAAVRSLFKLGSGIQPKRISEEFPFNLILERTGGATLSVESGFEVNLYLARLDNRTFVYGYSREYELNVIDIEGRLLYRFSRDAAAPAFSLDERRLFKHHPVPEMKPYFFDILTDSEGRIYIQRNKTKGILNTVQEKTSREVDIFSKDGYFLYTSILPSNTCEISDGRLYAYVVDEATGLESVKRYKIRNWSEILTSKYQTRK